MNVGELLGALKTEIELAVPDLTAWLAQIAAVSDQTHGLSQSQTEALDAYGAQVTRLQETSEMLGLSGITQFCAMLNRVMDALSAQDAVGRSVVTSYLGAWPALLIAYLNAPTDFDTAMAAAQYLAAPESPTPLGDEATLELMTALTTPIELPEAFAAELAEAALPIEISLDDTSLVLPPDADMDVYEAFMGEAPQKATELSRLAALLAAGKASAEEIRDAKRIAHSFKGSANIVGVRGIAALAHHTEDILEYVETTGERPPRGMAETILDAAGVMEQMVYTLMGVEEAPAQAFEVLQRVVMWKERVRDGEVFEEDNAAAQVAQTAHAAHIASEVIAVASARSEPQFVASFTPAQTAAPAAPRAPASAPVAPVVAAGDGLRVPVKTVDDLFRLVSEMTIKIGQLETKLKTSSQRSKNLLKHNLTVQQRIFELENMVMIRGLSLHKNEVDGEALDPLELDRYNELQGATRALVEVTADARELGLGIEDDLVSLANEVQQQGRMNKDLQHLVMSTRMTPVANLVPRLTRNVRQTAQSLGKKVELIVVGSEILVDGDILTGLADPLLHILRNAVDHGIELPHERTAAGKSESGTIVMEVVRQGNSIAVRVRDDGRGLDYQRIQSKGLERGLLKADAKPSPQELARLTLAPGFSTKESVNEISGRGVGMDVVAHRLEALKGSVDIQSVTGTGCEVILHFQASLVAQHALLIGVAGQTFAVPSYSLEQAVAAGLGEFALVGTSWTMRLGKRVARVQVLGELLGHDLPVAAAERTVAWLQSKIALIVPPQTLGGEAVALLVDQVIDSRDLIVKGMGKYLTQVPGVGGCAILGDGVIAPLLDVNAWLRSPADRARVMQFARAGVDEATRARVLVVDDSVSVRKSLTSLLRDFSYEVITANDGLEAIRLLQTSTFDLLLTDLEMPNLNGIELTEHVRANAAYARLPIVMITSRSMDKHRQMAERAGVDVYLTKPYTDSDLLGHVERQSARSSAAHPTVEFA